MRVDLKPPSWAAHLLSDRHDWSRRPLPVAELAPFDLPDDAYFEYAWLDASGTPRPDPDNHDRRNPWWEHACALVGPGYAPEPWRDRAAEHAAGRTRRLWFTSPRLPGRRRVLVYAPDGDFDAPRPAVYVQDGKGFYHYGRLPQVADALLAAGLIPPARLVFVQPADRNSEYIFNADWAAFMTEDLLPSLERAAPCDGFRALLGVSLGGLAAAWLAWTRPDLFAAVGAHSGAFLIGPDDAPPDPFAGSEWLRAALAAGEGPCLRWYLDCGSLEWLAPAHERLAPLLDARGDPHRLVFRSAGHNWENWRNGLAPALRFLLGARAARPGEDLPAPG